MRRLKVQIEYLGSFIPVGAITGLSDSDAVFAYDTQYLQQPQSRPISVSLPLQKEAFSPQETRTYFEGLLPEGYTRLCIADQLSVREQDDLSVLSYLGRECLKRTKWS